MYSAMPSGSAKNQVAAIIRAAGLPTCQLASQNVQRIITCSHRLLRMGCFRYFVVPHGSRGSAKESATS